MFIPEDKMSLIILALFINYRYYESTGNNDNNFGKYNN